MISRPWLPPRSQPRGTPRSQALPSAQDGAPSAQPLRVGMPGRAGLDFATLSACRCSGEAVQERAALGIAPHWGWMGLDTQRGDRNTCCILGVCPPCQWHRWLLLVAVLGRLTPVPVPALLPLCSGVGGNPPSSSGDSCRHLGKGWPRCTQAPEGGRCQDAAISRLTSKSSWGLARERSHAAHPACFTGDVLQHERCYIKPRIELEKQEVARRARLPLRRPLQRCVSTSCPCSLPLA